MTLGLSDISVAVNVSSSSRMSSSVMGTVTVLLEIVLIHLKLLPLMMELEIADIIFFIKSVRYPSDHFARVVETSCTVTKTFSL